MSLFTERVVVRRPGGPTGERDSYNRPIIGPPTTANVWCWYEPRGSSEDSFGRLQKLDGYMVYMPRETVIDADDQVQINGKWYELDGEPGDVPDGFILEGMLTLEVKRAEG